MPGEDLGQQDSAARSVTAGRDAYDAGRDITITSYAVTSPGVGDRDAAFRARVDRAVEELAEAVGDQWRAEERLRRIHDPVPLPVRWAAADPLLSDHPANIYRMSAAAVGLDGSLDRVAEAFNAISSRRLVVVGQPGAGKTVFTLRLTLDLLRIRRPGGEVPVIFGLHTWNPREQFLQDWMAARLAADYPALRGTGPSGRTIASELIRRRLVLPVLDGLDEVSESLRGDALRGLNLALDNDAPVVVTCREADYRAIVADADVLTSAAVVRLLPLGLSDLAGYLPRTTRRLSRQAPPGFATKWDPVIERLRSAPADPACQTLLDVLSTPLMTSLARSVYSDTPADPATLLHGDFGSRQRIEAHLLDAFIPAAFTGLPTGRTSRRRRRSNPEEAERWLTFLARHLDRLGTRDLRWWRLQDELPPPARWLATGLAVGAPLGLILQITHTSTNGIGWLFAACLGIGSILGLAVTSSSAPVTPRRRPAKFGRTALRRICYISAGTIPAGFALGICTNLRAYADPYADLSPYPVGAAGIALGLAYSALGGLALGAVMGTAGIEASLAPMTTPLRLRRKLRTISRRLGYGIGRGVLNGIFLGLALMSTWLIGYAGTVTIRVETAATGFPAGGDTHQIPGGGAYSLYSSGLRYAIAANGSRNVTTINKFSYYTGGDAEIFFTKKDCLSGGGQMCERHDPVIMVYTTFVDTDNVVVTPRGVQGFYFLPSSEWPSFAPWLSAEPPPLWSVFLGENNKEIAIVLGICFLFMGIIGGLFVWLGFPADVTQAISPPSTVASDRNAALFRGTVIAFLTLFVFFFIVKQFVTGSFTVAAAFSSITLGAVALSLSPWVRLQVARACLATAGRVPWSLMGFLDEAHSRGVLRQAGAVYQFRHARLQERLARRAGRSPRRIQLSRTRSSPARPRHRARRRI